MNATHSTPTLSTHTAFATTLFFLSLPVGMVSILRPPLIGLSPPPPPRPNLGFIVIQSCRIVTCARSHALLPAQLRPPKP